MFLTYRMHWSDLPERGVLAIGAFRSKQVDAFWHFVVISAHLSRGLKLGIVITRRPSVRSPSVNISHFGLLRTAGWILTTLARDGIVMVPYKCYFSTRSAQGYGTELN